jgi:hypothetical protein
VALPEPAIDTRTYRDILADALARVPLHTPEWNNLGPSDPGVTLLQLFAFVAESAIYRANRIPTRNRQKFLRNLGIGLQPAQPALGLVSFAMQQALRASLDDGTELTAGSVPFRVQVGLEVLPIESRMYSKQQVSDEQRAEIQAQYNRLYASIRAPAQDLQFYETTLLSPPTAGALSPSLDLSDTVDRSLWLALLAPARATPSDVRNQVAGQPLTLGIVPALDADGKTLYPAGPPPTADQPRLVFEVPDLSNASAPAYRALQVISSEDVLSAPGVITVTLPALADLGTWTDLGPLQVGVGGFPPALENSQDQQRLITWIRIRAPQTDGVTSDAGGQSQVLLSWVGVNAAHVVQTIHVDGERLPDGTGEPDQTAQLSNGNIELNSVVLTVNGEQWTRVDDLSEAAPEVPARAPRHAAVFAPASPKPSTAFVIDPASGEIRYNARPPRGAVVVCTYDYGGGQQGNVAIGALTRIVNPIDGMTVTNPIPTWGASDAETVAEAEERIPEFVRHREVAASKEDFEKLVARTPGVVVGRSVILPLMNPDLPDQVSEGTVTVLVIPLSDATQPEAPRPDRLFLETVCAYLEPRRVLTTELHICGPIYQRIGIGVGIQAIPGKAQGPLADLVAQAIQDFLSPLDGGFDGTGWPLNKTVEPAEVQSAASRVPGVAKVTGVLIVDDQGNALPDGLALSGIELPRVNPVRVSIGAVPTAAQILGAAPAETVNVLPVPVIPEDC